MGDIIGNLIANAVSATLGYMIKSTQDYLNSRKRMLSKLCSDYKVNKTRNVIIVSSSMQLLTPKATNNTVSIVGGTSTSQTTEGYVVQRLPQTSHEDLIAFGSVYGLLNSVGVIPEIEFDQTSISDANLYCIGGPAANLETKNIMDQLKAVVEFDISKDKSALVCHKMNQIFVLDTEFDYGLILKVPGSPNFSGYRMIFAGIWAMGTAAAGYYFVNNLRKIAEEFGNSPFFIVVKVLRSSGYRGADRVLSQHLGIVN